MRERWAEKSGRQEERRRVWGGGEKARERNAAMEREKRGERERRAEKEAWEGREGRDGGPGKGGRRARGCGPWREAGGAARLVRDLRAPGPAPP